MFRACLEKALGPQTHQLSTTTLERLHALDGLVAHWGRAIRLVGFKSQDERVDRYFAEALAALDWLPDEGRAMDIGSGGGSPALPLAIARPSVAWTLVEANERKAMFLREAIHALELDNVTVVHDRFENVELVAAVDTVSVRGVALEAKTLAKVGALLVPEGRLLWISSESRLSSSRAELETMWARCTGPVPLLRKGAFLLVAEHRR